MNRREALRYTAIITGGAIALPIASSLLSGCKMETSPKGIPFSPSFLSQDQYDFISTIIDGLLPTGEMPGALELGIPSVFDQMVGKVFKQEDQKEYMKRLADLTSQLNGPDQKISFVDLKPEAVKLMLQELEQKIKIPTEDKKIQSSNQAYREIKQQAIAYYLSTEEIGTNYLNYLPIPGKYKACITLEEVGGKAWAL